MLSNKTHGQAVDKGAKDYDTMKWEEELRAQLAQKKGQTKKLTPDEQAKVNAQLAKEAEIRREMGEIDVKLRRGVGIIQSLANGPPTDAEAWIGPAVDVLVDAINGGAGLIVGDAASIAYLDCAKRISPRLGVMRTFVGVATLRAMGITQLPQELQSEPLGGQSTVSSNNSTIYFKNAQTQPRFQRSFRSLP